MKNLLFIAFITVSIGVFAQPTGDAIVKKVNERNEGQQLTQQVEEAQRR